MPSFSTQSTSLFAPIAHAFAGHHDWGGGWWIAMVIGMVAFWALLLAGGGWLVRELSANRSAGQRSGDDPGPLGILDRRFAEGEISTEEYAERRRTLLEAGHHDGG